MPLLDMIELSEVDNAYIGYLINNGFFYQEVVRALSLSLGFGGQKCQRYYAGWISLGFDS